LISSLDRHDLAVAPCPGSNLFGAKNYQPNSAAHAKIDSGFNLTY